MPEFSCSIRQKKNENASLVGFVDLSVGWMDLPFSISRDTWTMILNKTNN
jgi:hypothetical protein